MTRLLLAVFAASIVFAQTTDPQMSSDRPGFRNSTHLVGPGVVQIENGLRAFQTDDSDRVGVGVDPAVRFGATPWLELRLYADTLVLRSPQERGHPERIVGASDLQAGVKFPIIGKEGGHLRVVGILKTSLPTGHPSQSAEGYQPGSELIFDQELPRDFSLSGTWNLTRLKEQDRFDWQQAGSLQFGRRFGRMWNSFVEVYEADARSGGKHEWIGDVALVRTLGRRMMMDAWVGRSMHGPRSWFVAVGLSVRTRVPRPE